MNPKSLGLYHPSFEHASCGFGLVADLNQGQSSHRLVQIASEALGRLSHRGAAAADGLSGDGCGLLMNKPDAFFQALAKEQQCTLAKIYAVGMVFFCHDKKRYTQTKNTLLDEIKKAGLCYLFEREVPTDPQHLGEQAAKTVPAIRQIFINAPEGMDECTFNLELFKVRRRTRQALIDDPDFYIASLSSQSICYKGLVMPTRLAQYYTDLKNSQVKTNLCLFHQRFSTNTLPRWKLAQPLRLLAHNGEINSISGNRNWCRASISKLHSKLLPDLTPYRPILSSEDSDSCSLDNMLELLVVSGMDLFQALKIMLPPAWQNMEHIDPDLRAFYETYAMHMEPWGGPAGLVLSSGRYAACALDRNGLRPARWVLNKDRIFTVASEVGVYDYKESDIIAKGRVTPGEMIGIDTELGDILLPDMINAKIKNQQPYAQWLKDNRLRLKSKLQDEALIKHPMSLDKLLKFQKIFGLTYEAQERVLKVLAMTSLEAIGSMGDDTPLAVLSRQSRSLYDYFRQLFAQVTNPAIDPIRENIAMSLEICFGPKGHLFEESEALAKRIVMDSPIFTEPKFKELMNYHERGYPHQIIDLWVDAELDYKDALKALINQAIDAIKNNAVILVLSDRYAKRGKLPIHALLATGAIHQQLMEAGLRSDVNIVVETATALSPHDFAVLIGYGATAIYPYLAYETIADLLNRDIIQSSNHREAGKKYRRGLKKGLYKILSKMGISTVSSYRGAVLFEIVGLHQDVVNACFKGTVSRIQGTDFADLKQQQVNLLATAKQKNKPLEKGGLYNWNFYGEYHAYNPNVILSLQKAVNSKKQVDYQTYTQTVHQGRICYLRDLIDLKFPAQSLSLDQVEGQISILSRFNSAAMSLGALSPEAHESLAIAMNRLGGRSNSGEGGEDAERFGTERISKIKQVASGRFGVTAHYLVNAEVIQIKISQGAKPGEGGQLPGEKVTDMIATLRFSMPGIALISPPPHHDIYSIEDLAQLIFDLKQVNPKALISVKLVASAGVGTIAVGVAKAHADLITIAGCDGGTGASPLTSIKHAGSPWELGLAETHQCLMQNNLRNRIRLEVDGGLKTGLDVVKAAILGAESFGFGTAPMVTLGCTYLRVCQLNTCATGVATQSKTLREDAYRGNPEKVIAYFQFVAEEVRTLLAKLGVKSINDLIGRTDLLALLPGITPQQNKLDLKPILAAVEGPLDQPRHCTVERNEPVDKAQLAQQIMADVRAAIDDDQGGIFRYRITNIDRSIGAMLSGAIAMAHGPSGLKKPLRLRFKGTAGQSIGAFNSPGLHIRIDGDANDYVGKGMSGGEIIIRPVKNCAFDSHDTIIMGNTCLYGATGGHLFACGKAGERFAVRNSGAISVVEGVGDHGCEYMTGGIVAVLGKTGINFGAGMTGGIAYVLDEDNDFYDRCNHELIGIHRIQSDVMEAHQNYLYQLIEIFTQKTHSHYGQMILGNFSHFLPKFWLVKPMALEFDAILDALSEPA